MGQFWHYVAVGGIGAARRAHHRASLADAVRRLRTDRGWSQEDLAERLETDRRQVVRIEGREVPVTLELIEALASAFGVPSLFLMLSVRDANGDLDVGSNWFRRIAGEEVRRVFGSSVSRPDVAWIARTVALLSDENVAIVGQVAEAMLRAQAVTDQEIEDYTPLGDSLLAGGRIGKRIVGGRQTRTRKEQVGSRRPKPR
jgi:transcriptional regulator with XRE-family HTH domain